MKQQPDPILEWMLSLFSSEVKAAAYKIVPYVSTSRLIEAFAVWVNKDPINRYPKDLDKAFLGWVQSNKRFLSHLSSLRQARKLADVERKGTSERV